MADVVNASVSAAPSDSSPSGQNATAKIPATPEGLAIAYGSLFIMALIPIFVGAFRSVKHQKAQKESGEPAERMTGKDAAMFPLIASGFLFGIYILFTYISKDYVNMLLSVYFFGLGVLALAHIVEPYVRKALPDFFPNKPYHLSLTQGLEDAKEVLLDYRFDRKDLVCVGLCSIFGVWYLAKKHWIANNILALAFSVNGIELLQLNSVSTGCILLSGLFVYDVFWVFATNVMVTVAKSFEAPIKLIFPQDVLEKGLAANNFAMLGLGDIVVPGIFIALLLRFDYSLGKNSKIYFYTSYAAYIFGMVLTMVVLHYFKHAQPALLYLVPSIILAPLGRAVLRGETKQMFAYEDNPEEPKANEAKETSGVQDTAKAKKA